MVKEKKEKGRLRNFYSLWVWKSFVVSVVLKILYLSILIMVSWISFGISVWIVRVCFSYIISVCDFLVLVMLILLFYCLIY